MKVLHFILGKANKERANGVNQVVAGLAKYSALHGANVRVIGKTHSLDHEGKLITRDGFQVEAYSRVKGGLGPALQRAIDWADIVHLHGVYSPWNIWVGRICTEQGKPFVLTLHDGLAPDRAVARSKIKKHLFHVLFQQRQLREAAAIHVLTEEEATEALACSTPRRIFCIPNGVDLEDFPSGERPNRGLSSCITLGYLGRLSEEKNLDTLCKAFAAVNAHGRLRLKLAGPDSEYGRRLLERYGQYGVEWIGSQFGKEKVKFIQSLDLFVQPSLCDAFSIAAMEVLALGVPILITRTAKSSYFYDRRAFFMCEPTVFGIERGLRNALSQTDLWPDMAARGRQLIEQRLNWSAAASDLLVEYERIVSGEHDEA